MQAVFVDGGAKPIPLSTRYRALRLKYKPEVIEGGGNACSWALCEGRAARPGNLDATCERSKAFDQGFEPTPKHSLAIEGHRFRVKVQAWIFHARLPGLSR